MKAFVIIFLFQCFISFGQYSEIKFIIYLDKIDNKTLNKLSLDSNLTDLIIIDKFVYSLSEDCLPPKIIESRKKDRLLSLEIKNRNFKTNQEIRNQKGNNNERMEEGNYNDRILSNDKDQRKMIFDTINRTLSLDKSNRGNLQNEYLLREQIVNSQDRTLIFETNSRMLMNESNSKSLKGEIIVRNENGFNENRDSNIEDNKRKIITNNSTRELDGNNLKVECNLIGDCTIFISIDMKEKTKIWHFYNNKLKKLKNGRICW